MSLSYVTEQGARISRTGRCLWIKKGEEVLGEIKVEHCEGLVLFGQVQVSTPALNLLFQHQISTTFLSVMGKIKGQCCPALGKNIPLRREQFLKLTHPDQALLIAKRCVANKIENTAETLRFHLRSQGQIDKNCPAELDAWQARALDAENRDVLMGCEGFVAKSYFQAFGLLFKGTLGFPGRLYHPANDPINALLSLTYTLIGTEIFGLLQARGLDPYLGFLHETVHSRPSLALDLLEAFRQPLADRFVLRCFNRGEFSSEDFSPAPDGQGLHLLQSSMKKYLSKYNHEMDECCMNSTWGQQAPRWILRQHVNRFATYLLGKSEAPDFFTFRHRGD